MKTKTLIDRITCAVDLAYGCSLVVTGLALIGVGLLWPHI